MERLPATNADADRTTELLPELYFATVRAMGTEMDSAVAELGANLGNAGFETETIRLSSLFSEVPAVNGYLRESPSLSEYDIRNSRMDAGDAMRTKFDTAAVAKLGLVHMCDIRLEVHRRARAGGRRGVAFIVLSLMHESEVAFLRAVLGSRFFLLSFFSREDVRRRKVILDLGARPGAGSNLGDETLKAQAEDLLRREQGREFLYEHPLTAETREIKSLNIQKTFHAADFFVDLDKREAAYDQIRRFVQLIFSDPYATTTVDETAMSHAFSAMRQSSSVARRVGAALVVDGILVTVGRNDIPEAGGGQILQAAGGRMQDVVSMEPKASREEREDVFKDTVRRLLKSEVWAQLLSRYGIEGLGDLGTKTVEGILKESLQIESVRDGRIFDLIEFNPTVHAEMSAITAAARKGIPLQGATLYTTTFPCHECTRHIVSTGIERVVYLEPYPKSRAEALFSRQIHLGERAELDIDDEVAGHQTTTNKGKKKVLYEPFMGVAPRRQEDLFYWVERGTSAEEIKNWRLNASRTVRPSIDPVVPDLLKQAREQAPLVEHEIAIREFRAELWPH